MELPKQIEGFRYKNPRWERHLSHFNLLGNLNRSLCYISLLNCFVMLYARKVTWIFLHPQNTMVKKSNFHKFIITYAVVFFLAVCVWLPFSGCYSGRSHVPRCTGCRPFSTLKWRKVEMGLSQQKIQESLEVCFLVLKIYWSNIDQACWWDSFVFSF